MIGSYVPKFFSVNGFPESVYISQRKSEQSGNSLLTIIQYLNIKALAALERLWRNLSLLYLGTFHMIASIKVWLWVIFPILSFGDDSIINKYLWSSYYFKESLPSIIYYVLFYVYLD